MNINKVPVVGKVNKTFNKLIINFLLLSVLFLILAVLIVTYSKALELIVAAVLVVTAMVFLNIAYSVYQYRKKLHGFFE